MDRKQRHGSYGVLSRDGRVLLCRLTGGPWDGFWTLPGGGIEFGEHPEETLVREVKEETGFEVCQPRLAKILSHVSEQGDVQFHVMQIIYFAEICGGVQADEVGGTTDRCVWVTKEEADSMPLVPLATEGAALAFGAI